MTQRYLTHFFATFFLHAILLVGAFQIVQSDQVQKILLPKSGTSILKMQIASHVVTNRPLEKTKATKTLPHKKMEEVVQDVQKTSQQGVAQGHDMGTSLNPQEKIRLIDLYKAELRAKIDQNKYYPTMSRRLGQTGTVVIAFTLLEDGNIVNVRIDSPSAYERLNASALDAVRKVERFKPIPKEVGENKMDIKVPVKFVTI